MLILFEQDNGTRVAQSIEICIGNHTQRHNSHCTIPAPQKEKAGGTQKK